MLRIQASAVPKPLITSYYELAKLLEIGIEAIDLSGNSLLQAVGVNPDIITQEGDAEGSTYMVANMYSGGTQLTFIKDGTVRLQRTISVGLGDSFDTLMLANADRSIGVLGYVLSADMDRDEMEAASAVATAKASELAFAINRIIEYYYSVEGYGNGKIYGTAIGQGVLLPAFVSMLFKDLDIECRSTHRIGADAEDADKEYGLYLPCIGACLNPLNLTDRALGMTLENICAKRKWLDRAAIVKRNFIVLAGASIFAVCILASAVMAGIVTVKNITTQNTINDYRAKIEVLAEVAEQNDIKLNAQSIRDTLNAYKQKLEQLAEDE